jgi:Pseudomonas avirulence D protein (AvrD).
MEKSHINSASDFLGKEETRYFSNGFRFMDYKYGNLYFENQEISCDLNIENKMVSKKDHLGAIEYVSIASTLCEYLIMSLFSLTEVDVANSWIFSCSMKICSCTHIDKNQGLKIWCKMLEVYEDASSINGYKSKYEVLIGRSCIKIGVDHPMNKPIVNHEIAARKIEQRGMYVTGYKERKHIIRDVNYSTEDKVCTASLWIEDYFDCRKGLGAGYRAFIVPDIINISGQLSQVLLYKLENMVRAEANNMWLREFSIIYDKPYVETHCVGMVVFSRFDEIILNGEKWRSVFFNCKIGDITAQFKIAHKLN